MSHYLVESNTFWPVTADAYNVKSTLPVGTYTVGLSQKGYYLKPITDFVQSGKIYGKTDNRAERILNTFSTRPNSTGVLLAGEPGSGKTMLAKLISTKGAARGISTIVINSAFTGDGFNTFIQSIDEPCIIVFDEFEKVFDDGDQEATLTLLDGVYPTKKLFILTVNNKYAVNTHLRNRPGRIFYSIEFGGVDADFIREYCNDQLVNVANTEQVVNVSTLFSVFNFDMLKALVEEMNRYNENAADSLTMLNAKPADSGNSGKHAVTIIPTHKKAHDDTVYPTMLRGSPLTRECIEVNVEVGEEDNLETCYYNIYPEDLVSIDPSAGKYAYLVNKGLPTEATVVFTREKTRDIPNYFSLLA